MKAKINKRQSTRYEITNAPTDPKIKKKVSFYRWLEERTDRRTDVQYMVAAVDEWNREGEGESAGKRGVATPNEEFPFLSSTLLFFWYVRMRAYKYLQSTGASTRCCLPGELSLPLLPPFPPPLTFSLQPQVLQLEYLYADALSTCSSCFPSFTLAPLLPLPRWLPLSLILSLFPSLPFSTTLSARFVLVIYAHCKNLSPPERLRHICFCGFSLTAQQPYPRVPLSTAPLPLTVP